VRCASVVVVGVVTIAGIASALASPSLAADAPNALRPSSDFAQITDTNLRSMALFEEARKIILSPRCVNCHPAAERPTQTDQMRPHLPPITRGEKGFGVAGMPCSTCHHERNFEPARVPGHPQWHLAPRSMAWEGQTLGQICAQIKDPARNGGRSLAAVVHHMAEDSLVGWAWSPGADRTPAPGTQREFGALLQAWVESGAACPSPNAINEGDRSRE
jgi:hypothetical protein